MKEKLKVEWISPVNDTDIIGNSLGYGLANKNLKDTLSKLYDLEWRDAPIVQFTTPQFFFRIPNKKNYLFCVVPGTKVLCSDLTWKNVEDLKIGQELVGFDEEINKENKFRKSIVQANCPIKGEAIKITTDRGEITCSINHKFVSRRHGRGGHRTWRRADELRVNDWLSFFREPWETMDDRDGGWLAGFIDGEGTLQANNNLFTIAQNVGPTLDYAIELLNKHNFKFKVYKRKTNYISPITGEKRGLGANIVFSDTISSIGRIRPKRLIDKSNGLWEGRRTWSPLSKIANILKIERIGEVDLIATQTTTGTLITDGYLSHNTMCEHEYLTEDYQHAFDRCDGIITPSSFCKSVFEKYTDKPIHICPLGVDTSIWIPKKRIFKPGKQKFRWLYCGAPNLRKFSIMEEVWKIFLKDFADVELYIKTTGADIPEELGDIVHSNNWIVDNRKLPIKDLVKLYHSSHAMLFLHLGEGYGLTALEAMATQMPLVVSNHTGTVDFCTTKNSFPVKTDLGKIQVLVGKGGDVQTKEIDAGIPNIISTMTQMANVMYQYENASNIARQASKDARKLTWENAAKRLKEILENLDHQ